MKVAIITDSNSGITQEEGKQLGIRIVPMPFMINGEEYLEDITLTQQEFYAKLGEGSDISTSQPSPESIMALWDEVLEEYDEIVHIPMSSGLSGSCQTAMMLAEDYDGKVEVVNNQRISVTQRQSALDAKELAAKGMCAAKIKEKLEAVKFDSSIYITLDTLKYLKKGGRITPAAAALGTLLRLKPVLTVQGEKLDAFAKARTMKQAKSIMVAAITKDLEERFGDRTGKNVHLEVAHTDNQEEADEFAKELRELFPEAGILRMDADTPAGGHEEILQTFERERVPILLGTQMVAKGLDFENVTLVGVLSADISLYVDNYRAAERTFSLLTQVVGRAGRGGKTGRAVIQTYTPGNDVIRCAARQDYDAFYESEIRMRRLRRYPPFADLFTVTVSGTEEGRVLRAAVSVRETLRQLCRRPELAAGEPEVLGPAPAPVVKVNNRFRYRCTLVGKNDKATREMLAWLQKDFAKDSANRGMNLFVDHNAAD